MTTFKTATPVKGTDLHFFYFDGLEGPYIHLREVSRDIEYDVANKGRLMDRFKTTGVRLTLAEYKKLRVIIDILPGHIKDQTACLMPVSDFIAVCDKAAETFRLKSRKRKLRDILKHVQAAYALQVTPEEVEAAEVVDVEEVIEVVTPPIEKRIEESRDAFTRFVVPELGRIIPGLREVIPVEGDPSPLAKALDMSAGVDHLLVCRRVGQGGDTIQLYGMSSRVSHVRYCYRNFTMSVTGVRRMASNYHRRKAVLQEGSAAVFPHYSVQAYVSQDGGRLLGMALTTTSELLRAIEEATATLDRDEQMRWYRSQSDEPLHAPEGGVSWRRNRRTGTIFASVPWTAIDAEVLVLDAPYTEKTETASQACLWTTL
jgi:hypothetical protein